MSFLQKFFLLCAGANIDLLKKCPGEIPKMVSIGITILFTGIFAGLSGGYAFHQVFSREVILADSSVGTNFFWGAIAMGFIWGFMILNLDRFIVMSIRKTKGFWPSLATALPRIFLAVIISFVVAKPLEIRIFADRIHAQIEDSKRNRLEERKKEIEKIMNKGSLDSLNQFFETKTGLISQRSENCLSELCLEAKADLESAKESLNRVLTRINPKIRKAKLDINFINNTTTHKYILDGEWTLTKEGQKLLQQAEANKASYSSQLSQAYARRNEKRNIYQRLNGSYQESNISQFDEAERRRKINLAKQDSVQILIDRYLAQSAREDSIAFTNNLITQYEALGELTKKKMHTRDEEGEIISKANNSMYYMGWAILILFIIIETAPIFVKLIISKGQYDIALDSLDAQVEAQLIHNANNNIDINEQQNQLELHLFHESLQVKMDTFKKVLQAWEEKKSRKMEQEDLSEEEFEKVINEIKNLNISKRHENGNLNVKSHSIKQFFSIFGKI